MLFFVEGNRLGLFEQVGIGRFTGVEGPSQSLSLQLLETPILVRNLGIHWELLLTCVGLWNCISHTPSLLPMSHGTYVCEPLASGTATCAAAACRQVWVGIH